MQSFREMRIRFLILTACLFLASFAPQEADGPRLDREEAQKVFELVNKIRDNPKPYYSEFQLSENLPITKRPLVWNDTLAGAAEKKAMDMAKRKYFSHVDPDGYGMNHRIHQAGYELIPAFLKQKSANTFESLAGGLNSGEETVRTLILDEGLSSKGHRNHLLGIEAWNSSLMDIGVGFVRCDEGCKMRTYVCILIAKHAW